MTTDKTWFDERLKGNLYLDICLRGAIWLVIAFLTIAYTSHELGFSPLTPLQKSFNSLMPVVADVARVGLILCFLALLLKDLEHVSPDSWGQETGLGRVGGVIRRLAGDLSLWILGALVTVLASLIYFSGFAYIHDSWTRKANGFSITIGFVLVIAIAIFSIVSVWVRRKSSLISSQSSLTKTFNSPWKVIFFYGLLVAVVVISGR